MMPLDRPLLIVENWKSILYGAASARARAYLVYLESLESDRDAMPLFHILFLKNVSFRSAVIGFKRLMGCCESGVNEEEYTING